MAARVIFRLAAGLFGVSVLPCILEKCGLDLPSRAIKDHIDDNASLRYMWDSPRLQQMAVDPRMKTTMKLAVHNNINRSGAVINPSQTLEERIDSVPVTEIRTAMLISLVLTDIKNDDFATFATLDDAEATCATAETAGGEGVDVCTAQCHQKSRFWSKMPDEGACYVLCSVAVHPCTRRVTWGDWGATTMTAAKKMVDKIPMGETTTKMLAATVSSVSTMPTASYVWAAESMAAVKRGVKAEYVVLFLGVVGLAWTLSAITSNAQRELDDAKVKANYFMQADAALKIRSLIRIRRKVLLRGAFDDIHLAGAWSIYHSMKKESARANQTEACKILERLAYQHERRKKAVKFTQWKSAIVTLKAVDEALGRKWVPCPER